MQFFNLILKNNFILYNIKILGREKVKNIVFLLGLIGVRNNIFFIFTNIILII